MSLIGMCAYSTSSNGKDDCLDKTLNSLDQTVDFDRHRLMISVNGYTEETLNILSKYRYIIEKVIFNDVNLGTAEAINKVWKERRPGEHAVKMDDDVVIYNRRWADLMEECIQRDPLIGICGLKRKDLIQSPSHPDPHYRSSFVELPHKPGEKWITIEKTPDVIGTCTMFNSALLDKVGYSLQPGQYGFEDNLFCHRSHLAGFYNCFLMHIEIDHIDPGGGDYQSWKEKHSGEKFKEYHTIVHDMIGGKKSIYYNPFQ